MPETVHVDIVLVNFHSDRYLLSCLKSIYAADTAGLLLHVFVQDNGSQNGLQSVRARFPEIRITTNRTNLGFGKAINQAVGQGASPYILLLNPDTLLSQNFFTDILPFIIENPRVGVVGPRILDKNGTIQGSARVFPTPGDAFFGRNTLLTRFFPNNCISRKKILTIDADGISPFEADWVSGACMLIRRQAFQKIGGFDERFFLYWEDADLCRRMWIKNWKVYHFPEASILHSVGGSSSQKPLRSIIAFHKSSYRLIRKYNIVRKRAIYPVIIAGLAVRIVLLWGINLSSRLFTKIMQQEGQGHEALRFSEKDIS
jgi:GT2 family glycosyltransferase